MSLLASRLRYWRTGAGKGVVARTFGKFFGKHFAHIANGDQLTVASMRA